MRARTARLKEEGICVTCGQVPALDGMVRCKKCTWRSYASKRLGSTKKWEQLRDLWLAQDKKCALTGRPVDIGNHLSVDHILPVSKYPELSGDIDNIQIVHYHVNTAKWDLPHSEFVQLCREVVEHNDS